MTKHTQTRPSSSVLGMIVTVATVTLAVVLVLWATADNAAAQQIPPRSTMLQLERPIVRTPIPAVDRLRIDVIRATDPRTGTVDVRQLEKRPGPSLGGAPGWTPVVTQQGSRPGPSLVGPPGGWGSDAVQTPTRPGPSLVGPRNGPNSGVTQTQTRPWRSPMGPQGGWNSGATQIQTRPRTSQ